MSEQLRTIEVPADKWEQMVDKLIASAETQQKVMNKLYSELPSIVDEKRYISNATNISVPAQSRNPQTIKQVIAIVGAAGGTLILGERRIPLGPGSSFITGPFLLNQGDARALWNGSPESPGAASYMGLELMGEERGYLSF